MFPGCCSAKKGDGGAGRTWSRRSERRERGRQEREQEREQERGRARESEREREQEQESEKERERGARAGWSKAGGKYLLPPVGEIIHIVEAVMHVRPAHASNQQRCADARGPVRLSDARAAPVEGCRSE